MANTTIPVELSSTPGIVDNSNATAITIDSSENVGIGTSSPYAPLTVRGTGDQIILDLNTSTNGAYSAISWNTSTSDLGSLYGAEIRGYRDAAGAYGALAFHTRPNGEAMRIDSSGNVGIGVSSPTMPLDVAGACSDGGNTGANVNQTLYDTTSYALGVGGGIGFAGKAGSGSTLFDVMFATINGIKENATNANYSSALTFKTRTSGSGLTERLRIDSSGNLLVGTTATPSLAGLAVGSTASGKNISVFSSANGSNGVIGIYQSNGTQEGQLYAGTGDVNLFGTSVVKIRATTGRVQLTSGATSWTSISDERSKDIIEPISNAVQKVSNLRSVIGKYKTDSEGTRRSFLIAQDVQAVFPEAVDTTDEDNLGVRYTETIPLLVAAIKEQQTLIESLTARITTLEG